MCTSGGRQCKAIPILGLHVLVHPKQTWTFPLHDIAIKVAKGAKHEIKLIISSDFLFVPNILSFPSVISLVLYKVCKCMKIGYNTDPSLV